MTMKRLNYFALLLVFLMAMPVSSLQAKNKKDKAAKEQQTTTGAQDRAVWVELMWKIAYPVIHNLAENTLRQNMPIESPSGNPKGYDEITHLEAVGRTLAGCRCPMTIPKRENFASRCVKKC